MWSDQAANFYFIKEQKKYFKDLFLQWKSVLGKELLIFWVPHTFSFLLLQRLLFSDWLHGMAWHTTWGKARHTQMPALGLLLSIFFSETPELCSALETLSEHGQLFAIQNRVRRLREPRVTQKESYDYRRQGTIKMSKGHRRKMEGG